MMRSFVFGLAIAVTAGQAAYAGSFAIVGNVGGGVIGAIHGSTLYGTNPYGGGYGQIFALPINGTEKILYSFAGADDGAYPRGQIAITPSGTLFGAAGNNGKYGGGTLWKYTATAAKPAFSVIHALGGPGNGIGPNGAEPDGSGPDQGLTRNARGSLFGTTSGGTNTGNGNVFTITASGQYVVLHIFQSADSDGHCPFSGAGPGPNGFAYGTSSGDGYGGQPQGGVWKVDALGNLTSLYLFKDGVDGEYPNQTPTVDALGNVFGTTYVQNGSGFPGAIYKITTGKAGTVLHDFVAASDGDTPNAPLVLGNGGLLYGTTAQGGAFGGGTLFSISKTGIFTVIHAFTGGADGSNPSGNLIRDKLGRLYGGTSSGPVFQYTP